MAHNSEKMNGIKIDFVSGIIYISKYFQAFSAALDLFCIYEYNKYIIIIINRRFITKAAYRFWRSRQYSSGSVQQAKDGKWYLWEQVFLQLSESLKVKTLGYGKDDYEKVYH